MRGRHGGGSRGGGLLLLHGRVLPGPYLLLKRLLQGVVFLDELFYRCLVIFDEDGRRRWWD